MQRTALRAAADAERWAAWRGAVSQPSSLIEIQLDALFIRGIGGDLVATRDPSPRPAPRVFLGRSVERNVWAVHEALDPATKAELERMMSAEPRWGADVLGSLPACNSHVRGLLDADEIEFHGPAYVLGDDLPCDDRAREITASETSEWLETYPWLAKEFEAVAPVAIAFEEGQPAAICHSPRGVTLVAAEAGVETLEHFRARGLATAAVACWARAVQRRGRLALYSTSWDNKASQGVARRLSARLYGEDWHIA